MLAVKLNEMMGGAIQRVVPESDPSRPGGIVNKRVDFIPGEWVKVTDPISQQYFKGEIQDCRERMVLTANLKSQLEAYGIPYEKKKCGTCANASTKAIFNPFVWKEIEDEK